MARTSHIKIQREIQARIKIMPDREFFLGRAFGAYLTDIAEGLSKRYNYQHKIKVVVKRNEEVGASIACTDNLIIEINAGSAFIKAYSTREGKYDTILGLLLHEVGHLLYTNFKLNEESAQKLVKDKTLLPVLENEEIESKEKREKALSYLATIKNKQILTMIASLRCNLFNMLEDAHINGRVCKKFPGYKNKLNLVLELLYEELPMLDELRKEEKESGKPYFQSLFSLVHTYALFAEVKCKTWEYTDKRIQILNELMEIVDESIEMNDSAKRMAIQNMIFIELFHYMQPYIDHLLELYGNEDTTPESAALGNQVKQIVKERAKGATEMGISSSAPSEEVEKEEFPNSATQESNAADEEEKTSKEKSEEENGETNKDSAPIVNQEDSTQETFSEEVSETESEERHLNTDNDTVSNNETRPDSEKNKRTSFSEEQKRKLGEAKGSEKSARDIERILNKMTQEETAEACEKEREKELNAFAATISHNEIHRGISCQIRRITKVDDSLKEQYRQIAGPLEKIGAQIIKKLLKILNKKKQGDKISGLYTGKHFDATSLIHNDGKYFVKKIAPSKKPTIAIGLLIDESGSMSCADRITYARASAIALYNFCTQAQIPIGVFGHQTMGSDVYINVYAEFKSFDKDDKYRLMDISAGGSNRDGYAIRYVGERLIQQQADINLLIVISDGQPAHYQYSGVEACEDIAATVKALKKQEVITIAAAIGEDKQIIESIYRENYLDIKNLEELPITLTNLVKKYVR